MAIIVRACNKFSVKCAEKNNVEFERNYQITRTDSEDEWQILSAFSSQIGINIGDPHPSLAYARCRSIDVTQPGVDMTAFAGVVLFSTQTDDKEHQDDNPFNRPVEISGGFAQFQQTTEVDIYGNPILTSANHRFDEPIEKDDSRPELTITRNEPEINIGLWYQYRDALNAEDWFGGRKGTWKVKNITFNRVIEGQYIYFKVTYSFAYNEKGWAKKPLDADFTDKNNKPILGKNKKQVVKPELLDGNGFPIARDPSTGDYVSKPVYLEFDVYFPMPFNALRLLA